MHFRYDDAHPVGASQHQKVVVIDDAMAFVGGIDLTVRRWDCCDHAPEDPRRTADDKPYPPFHDTMIAVDGEAAQRLAEHRARALAARHRPAPQAARAGPNPTPGLPSSSPTSRGVEVGIARTMPPRGELPAVREVEKLYLDMIAAARRDDLHREPVLHRAAHRRRAREAPRRARRAGDRAGAAPAQPRLARGSDDARAAHAPHPEAAAGRPPRPLPRLLPARSGAGRRLLPRRAFEDDGGRRRDAAHRLGEPVQPLDGDRHRVRRA